MISRIWHGWTTPGNADTYEALLKEEIFVGIENRHIRGFKRIKLLRRTVGDEVELVTIMESESLDAVRECAGKDYEVSAVPPAQIAAMIQESLDVRQQLLLHRSGDGSVEVVFNAMERYKRRVDWKTKRLRIEDGDGLMDNPMFSSVEPPPDASLSEFWNCM